MGGFGLSFLRVKISNSTVGDCNEMDKTILILCLVCFLVSSDAAATVFPTHDGMHMESPPPPMTPSPGDSGHHMNNTTGDDDDSHGMSMSMTMSHMTFFWGRNTEVLFSGWPGDNAGMYGLALVFVFVLAVIVEWLSHFRFMREPAPRSISAGIVQTVVHAIRIGIAYMVMLALMSFNGGVFIVAVAGHSVGFLVFGSRLFKKKSSPDDQVIADLPPRVC